MVIIWYNFKVAKFSNFAFTYPSYNSIKFAEKYTSAYYTSAELARWSRMENTNHDFKTNNKDEHIWVYSHTVLQGFLNNCLQENWRKEEQKNGEYIK